MTDDNLDDVQQPSSVGISEHAGVLMKDFNIIWNAAIEAAASVIDQCNREGPYQAIAGAKRIRELKK